ncbi:MMD family protein [Megaselia abdita]
MENIARSIQSKYSFFDNLWQTWARNGNFLKLELKNIKWKNKPAHDGKAYVPTSIEHFANVVTHGLWIIPAVYATFELFDKSSTREQFMVALVYGSTLIFLFLVSTFFHCVFFCNSHNSLKNALHRCDRAMIYVFIAGSYFPWLQLVNTTKSLVFTSLEWLIWILAALGITYQQLYHERFKWLETLLYLVMGLGPALVVIFTGHEFNGMTELEIGGLLYIIGIGFFKSDGRIPLAHAIWHLFVVLAASVHYYAIWKHLFSTRMIVSDI